MKIGVSGLFLAALLSLLSSSALAQDANDAEARALYQAGVAAMQAERPTDAVGYFERSYALSHRAALQYNLGVAHEAAGDVDAAIASLERYLSEEPSAENRAQVEARIVSLRARQHVDETPSRTVASDGPDVLALTLTLGGAAVFVGGALLFGLGYADNLSVEQAAPGTPWPDARDAYERGPVFTGVGTALAIGGLVSAGLGLVLWLGSSSSSTQASARIVPGGLSVQGTF